MSPGRQQTSLSGGSAQHIGPFVPLGRESPTAITPLFFLMDVIMVRGIGLTDLGDTSGVDGLAFHTQSLKPVAPRHLAGQVGKEGVHLPSWARTCLGSIFPFRLLPSACRREDTGSLFTWVFSGVCSHSRLREGRTWLHQCLSWSEGVYLLLCGKHFRSTTEIIIILQWFCCPRAVEKTEFEPMTELLHLIIALESHHRNYVLILR